MTDTKFICSGCGACCRRVGTIPNFPEPINPDGSCSHLKGNDCSIYETRPDICRVEKQHQTFEHTKNLSLKKYYQLTNSLCNMWQIYDGMDDKYLIDIKGYDV